MKTWLAIAAMAVSGAAVCAGQQPEPAPAAAQADQPARFSLDVTRVNLLFTVTDKKGRFITNLEKDDFEVIENKKPQTIREFLAVTDMPLRLGILIDTSNSIRDRFRFEQQAATQFIQSVIHPSLDKALVMSFDTQAQLASDMASDTNQIERAIAALRPGGGTSLYDAIYLACRDKLDRDQPRYKFRHAIVILSDGDDTQSHYTRDQALEMAQRTDVVIYAISTNISRVESDGDKVLKYFTQETGGVAYFPFKVEDLEQEFQNIAAELRHQYNVSYNPVPLSTDGLFHRIQLGVKGRKDLVVRVRNGYFAQKM